MIHEFKKTYAQMQLDRIEKIESIYANNVEFIDPFHRVNGLDALKQYFFKMYQNLIAIEFDFKEETIGDNCAFIGWDMHLSHASLNSGKPFTVAGSSLIKFHPDGKIYFHQDYFDGGALIYERIPLIGSVIRWIRNKV